jgi:predicted metal-binding protein
LTPQEHDAAAERWWEGLHGCTEAQGRRWLEGKRQQMDMHDMQPQRLRQLVAEHNVSKAQAIYNAELMAANPKCPHGRFPGTCGQCAWSNRGAR